MKVKAAEKQLKRITVRVNFTKVLSALNAENAVIDKKLEDCQDRISRLSKLTL